MDDGTGIAGVDALVVWCIAGAAVAGAGAIVWRVLRGTRRIIRLVDSVAEDWQGTEGRPGVPAQPGVMERLCRIETRLGGVERQVGRVLLDAPDVGEAPRVRSVG